MLLVKSAILPPSKGRLWIEDTFRRPKGVPYSRGFTTYGATLHVLPETEFEVKLEGGDARRSLSLVVVEGDPELDEFEEVHVGL